MEIIVGKGSGFCNGVNRSVNESLKLLENNRLYFLGELVHNKEVVNYLVEHGAITVESLDEVPDNSKVIIRAHGVAKEVYSDAKKRNIELIDLTCPKVLLVQKLAKEISEDFVIVLGKSTHPEIIGITSYLNNYKVIDSIDEVDGLISYIRDNSIKNISLLSQTTFSVDKFNSIIERLKDFDINIHNTICDATDFRQRETKKLASIVDKIIIIGGSNSSNTRKLYDISSPIVESYIIETYRDLDGIDLTCNKIGIMAGASTPEKSIKDVVNYLETNY